MSRETLEWLNTNTLIGFTKSRGNAWHYRAGATNHFEDSVPTERVRELFGWDPVVLKDTYEWQGKIRRTGEIKVVRGDNGDFLGTFKEDYQPHPYREWLLTKVETLLGEGLGIGSAGLLRNGAQAWVSVEVPEAIDVNSVGEKFRPALLACTSLNGTLATTYKRHVTRVVCDNTLGVGLGEKLATVKVRHTSGSLGKLNILTARDALGIVFQTAEDFAKEVDALVCTTVTDQQWSKFLDLHMGERPTEKGRGQTVYDTKRLALKHLYRVDERVAPWSNTAWGVIQAVNTYNQHLATVRGVAKPIRNLEKTLKGDFEVLDSTTANQLALVLGK